MSMASGINYISAKYGGLDLFYGDYVGTNTKKVHATTVEGVTEAILKYGMSESVWKSSSMDFASEYGFAFDEDASKLFGQALAKAAATFNGKYANAHNIMAAMWDTLPDGGYEIGPITTRRK